MHRPNSEKPQRDVQTLIHLLQQHLSNKRNLVYYASGRHIQESYFSLPFDNVVLVDYAFRDTFTIKGKVITIGLTALQATAVFKEAGIKFDAFVCINEGLWEGGGSYPINGNWSLGTILPVLKDEYLHIACPEYYGRRRWKRMFNLPHKAVLLTETDEAYVDPTIFSDLHTYGKDFYVWRVTKQPGSAATFTAGNRKITVQRKNIWEDYDALDALFVRCSPHEARNIKSTAAKAVPFYKDYSTKKILRYCNDNKITKLGLSPWRGGQYDSFINFLKENEDKYPYPQEVGFYHLHPNDFEQLYARVGVKKPILKDPENNILPPSQYHFNLDVPFTDSKKLKILYLHGFDSSLSLAKRKILEQYGEVVGPTIDYRNEDFIRRLAAPAREADIIIGSSFGGLNAHNFSMEFNKPALLFNPAFVTKVKLRKVRLYSVGIPLDKPTYSKIVLGKDDDVVVFSDNKAYIEQNLKLTNLAIAAIEGLGHRIPEDLFAEQVAAFILEFQNTQITSTLCK
jgi:hypothetical protein